MAKDVIKNSNKNIKANKTTTFNSREKRAYYIGFGLGLTDNLYFEYPSARKYIKTLPKKESDSFSNGFFEGSSYKNKEKYAKLKKQLKHIKNN